MSEHEDEKAKPALSPLERIKARQAQTRKNLAAKGLGSTPGASDDAMAPTENVAQKQMRSSATRSG